ncbi:hypothetical protein [Lactococcus chungangensis]|uniref:hypothetical protein n=1 Tax=Pseudolactococcus chungangensis TaxID=451457 RepID=UPI0037355D32
MTIKISKNKSYLFAISFILILISSFFTLSVFSSIISPSFAILFTRYFLYISAIISIINIIFFSENSTLYWLIAIFSIIITFVIYLQSKQNILFILVFLTLSAKNTSLKTNLKIFLSVIGVLFIVTTLLSIIKLIPNFSATFVGSNAKAYGMIYSVFSTQYISFLYLFWCLLKNKNFSNKDLLMGIIVTAYIFSQGDQLNFIISFFSTLGFYLLNVLKNNKRLQEFILSLPIYLYIFLFFISIFVAKSYNSSGSAWVKINSTFSNRPKMSFEAFQNYQVHLMGQEIQTNTWTFGKNIYEFFSHPYFYIDMSFILYLLEFGIIGFLIFSSLYFISFINFKKSRNIFLTFVMCLIIIHGFVNTSLGLLPYCILPIFSLSNIDI